MIIADLAEIAGRSYPARRRTQNLVGGASPIQASNFSMGNVTLEPNGGQVPWHNQDQEEIYFIVEGTAEMCLGEERSIVHGGQAWPSPRGLLPGVPQTPAPLAAVLTPLPFVLAPEEEDGKRSAEDVATVIGATDAIVEFGREFDRMDFGIPIWPLQVEPRGKSFQLLHG